MLTKITYAIIYTWAYLHAILPFRCLYILSDIFYLIVYHLVGYRLKVVRSNMKNAFPEKTSEELKKLEKDFYHHFCDYFVETLKLLHISDQEMQKRMVFKNVDVLNDVMKDGNSCILYLGHYCNWEWVPSLNLLFPDKILLAQIYRPLKNVAFDNLFLKIRGRFGSLGIKKDDTFREIIRQRRAGQQMLLGFISDQSPSGRNIHYWTQFLNQDTAVFTGVERIAKQTGFAVAYLDMKKIKRGYYEAECRLITDNPKAEGEFAITEAYVQAMEKSIQYNPAYWLWSHKRWKHKKEEFKNK